MTEPSPPSPPPPSPPSPVAQAVSRRWEHLAAQAWRGYQQHGRGLLVLEARELVDDVEPPSSPPPSSPPSPPTPTFIPVTMVPRGDDFRPLLLQYDPHREIVLLVRGEDGEETLMTLAVTGDRLPPPECAAADASAGS